MSHLTDQQLQALDLDIYTIVTANAGSGKTFILTKRFIETILKKNVKFKEIVAITFTEKAASELVYKISKELDEVLERTKVFTEYQKLKQFREHILSAKISTIHSFCFDLLREFPIEAEIDPSTEIIDDLRKRELIEKSVEDTLIEFVEKNEEGVRDLLRMFGKENTIDFLKKLIEKRYFTDKLIEKIYLSNGEFDFQSYLQRIREEAKNYFKSIYEDKLKEALQLLPSIKNEVTAKKRQEILDQIDEIENAVSSFLNDLDFSKLQNTLGLICKVILRSDYTVRKSNFKNANEHSSVFQFQKIISEFADFTNKINFSEEFEEIRFKHIKALIDIYNSAKEKFKLYKTLEGVLDFEDLLILAEKLLDNQKVQQEISNRYKFILVDEFQDTDSIQFNIIRKITNNFDDDHNVFVVGDEKQSIYGFRNAQLTVFQDFKKEISNRYSKTKGVVTLSTSFRSTPSIAAFVNRIFSSLLSQQKKSQINYHQEVEYSELQVGREEYSNENILFLVSEYFKEDDDNSIQSEKVANYILHLVNSGKDIFDRNLKQKRRINFGDIALLFRTNKEMKSYENVFIRKGIPFVVSGGRGYYQSEEIRDWLNYLNFLSNPRNDDSLIAILRSPFFALSDNLILYLSLNFENQFSYFERLKFAAEKVSDEHPFKEIYSILNHHIQIASRYNIPELLQRILVDTNYYGKIDGHPKKFQIIANIEKLINEAHNFVTSGLEDLRTFSDYLKEAFEKEETAEAVISEIRGSVQLMTMHQAKGLEFPIVILPNFEKNLSRHSDRFGEISINDYFGFCFKIYDEENRDNYHSLSSFFGNKINQGIEINEQLRLLYVALTRATEKLVISFTHNFNAEKPDTTFSFKNVLIQNLPQVGFNQNNSLSLQTKLKFLKTKKDKPTEVEENFNLVIEIIKDEFEISEQTFDKSQQITKEQKELSIQIDQIKDRVKNEIFTATQLNVYQFCPAKYLLKFIINYIPHKIYLSEKIDEDEITGADFGLVFHQLMEKISKADLEEADKLLDEILSIYPESIQTKFKQEVLEKFKKLLKEKTFVEIINHQNSLREFEIKVKFKNHFLLGVIDRINKDEDEIVIIDYKTDNFESSDYDKKVTEYLHQMEFYAFISSIFFKTEKIKLILFFINHPDKPYIKKFSLEELKQIEKKFEELIQKIEKQKFEMNENNCSICEYATNSKCVLVKNHL